MGFIGTENYSLHTERIRVSSGIRGTYVPKFVQNMEIIFFTQTTNYAFFLQIMHELRLKMQSLKIEFGEDFYIFCKLCTNCA